MKLVGPDALPAGEQLVLFTAEMIKNGFLQQNSFDPKDMFCSPEKQILLLKSIVEFHDEAKRLLSAGVPLKTITSLDIAPEIIRLKSEVGTHESQLIEEFLQVMRSRMKTLDPQGTETSRGPNGGEQGRIRP